MYKWKLILKSSITIAIGRKNRALQVRPVVTYKALESFPRLCVGQREVLAAHDFSVLLWFDR